MKTWDDALQVRMDLKKEVVRKLIREAIGCTRSLGNIASFKENFLISDEKIFRSLIMYGLIRMYTLLSIHIILKLQRKPIQIRNQTIFLLTPCRFICFYCYHVKNPELKTVSPKFWWIQQTHRSKLLNDIIFCLYRVFIKYCVFSLKYCDFSELCQFSCSAGFRPTGVCTHTDTEGKQSPEY